MEGKKVKCRKGNLPVCSSVSRDNCFFPTVLKEARPQCSQGLGLLGHSVVQWKTVPRVPERPQSAAEEWRGGRRKEGQDDK